MLSIGRVDIAHVLSSQRVIESVFPVISAWTYAFSIDRSLIYAESIAQSFSTIRHEVYAKHEMTAMIYLRMWRPNYTKGRRFVWQ